MTSFDVIVVGCGMAGLNAALSVAEESPDLNKCFPCGQRNSHVSEVILRWNDNDLLQCTVL